MSNPTGFLKYERVASTLQSPAERLKHFKEFEKGLSLKEANTQAQRCMDCGVPFCHSNYGCPVENLIPEFNDLVTQDRWQDALNVLHATNNFPEFTGRLCPAPCESACTLGLIEQPVDIKHLEKTIIDQGFEKGWVNPQKSSHRYQQKVAIVGSGPAGLACAQQLVRDGFGVDVYERMPKAGGLLRYGIPDFKMEKNLIDRRLEQLQEEGVRFFTNTEVGKDISVAQLHAKYQAIVLAIGSEQPRDLKVPGRDLKGVHFAMDFLVPQNRLIAGEITQLPISAHQKNVVIIGGGDTGADCAGTALRQGAKSVTQLELLAQPPLTRVKETNPWPQFAKVYKQSSSHEEGTLQLWAHQTTSFDGDSHGQVTTVLGRQHSGSPESNNTSALSDFQIPADLVLLAMGFTGPKLSPLLEQLQQVGVSEKTFLGKHPYQSPRTKIFTCGDARRGQSLIVWAIHEGRECAQKVAQFLMQENATTLEVHNGAE